jgi:hypothetical protein
MLRSYVSAAALLIAGLFLSPVSGMAQEMPTEIKTVAYLSAGGGISGYQIDYGKHVLGGATVYVDFNFTQRYGIEGEGRWLFMNQAENVHASTKLVGPRITFYQTHGISAYAKVLVGSGHFNLAYNYESGNSFVVAPGAGVDINLHHRLILRVIDVEYQDWPQFATFGSLHPYGVSAGVSYRIF